MGALRCPMCCKRKFRTQMSLKYHILSYMYNIFCTLCSRRVENMQELIDHLEVGCEKAYSASLKNVPTSKDTMVQTQEEVFYTKRGHKKNSYDAEEVQVKVVEGQLSASLSDDDSSTWSLSYCQDNIPDLPDDQVQIVPGIEGCNIDNVPASSTCNTSTELCKEALTKKTFPHQLFTCSVCRTTFSCVEKHVKLYHSEQDVEVHRQDSTIMHFWKSRRKGTHTKVNVVTSSQSVQATSTVQDSALSCNSREPFFEEPMEQAATNSGGVSECFNITSNLIEKTKCDISSKYVQNKEANQNFKMLLKQRDICSYKNNRNSLYRNNRDTEHAYCSTREKTRAWAVQTSRSSLTHETTRNNLNSHKGIDGVAGGISTKDKMLCVCSPSNHQQCQHKATQEPNAAIEFSKAIPELFPQKNGKGIPTVVVFNGNKLTSILTPMTSSVNIKSLQKCKSLAELVNVIGSQRTYTRAIVKSTGEPLYRDSSGMFYARKLIPRCDSPSDELNLNGSPVIESNICPADNETGQERGVNDYGKHELATACIRKKKNKQFVIKKIIDVNGKFLDNRYACKCGREFRTYRTFWKHDCDKETNICSCPDCDNQHTKKRILTIQFKDIEPEVDSQKAMIEIGLGINTETESYAATESTEELKMMQTEVVGISTKDSIGVKSKIREGRRTKKVKAPKKVPPPPQTMVCNICSTVFTKKVAFVGHQRMHAPKVVRVECNADGTPVDYTCKICTFVAEHRRGLNQHMRVHFPEEYEKKHAEKHVNDAKDKSEPTEQGQETIVENNVEINTLALTCRHCGMVFSRQIHLDEHVCSHSYNVEDYVEKESSLMDTVVERAVAVAPHTFTCEICSKTLDVVFRQVHIQTHFGDERFTCEICNKNLYMREQYNLHMRAHKGDNPYICRVCRKKFCSLEELEQHVLSHNGSKRYACRFCDRWFKRPISKVEHERLHTGEKPFSCSFCGMKFRLKGTRELHVRIHTGLKPYCCEVCKKCFRSKYNLRAHVAIHSDERNFKCSICPKTFKTAVSLSSHKNHHTKPYKCPVCLRRFDSSYSERQHRKSHSAAKSTLKYKCTICGIMYARSFGLRDHMLTHNVVETDQSSELEYCGVKNDNVSESMEIVDDECTQTADLEFAEVDDECIEAAEFLVVNSSEDCFQTPNYVLQVSNEATQGFVGDDSDEAYVQTPEMVVNLPNDDGDYPGSIYAVTEDYTEAGAYLIAADDDRQQPVGLLVVETSKEGVSDSQYVLAVTEKESAEVPQLELSDIYDECGLSGVVRSHNQDCNEIRVGLSNCTALVSVKVEENECVPPVPVNFEEVQTEVEIEPLDYS